MECTMELRMTEAVIWGVSDSVSDEMGNQHSKDGTMERPIERMV